MARKPHVQLEALHALARAFAGGEFRARTVLERACAAVARGFGFERVGIVRYLPESSTLVPFAAFGLTPAELVALPSSLPLSAFGAFERALASGRAELVVDPAGESIPPGIVQDFGIGSFVIVPLVSDGRCLGFMTCDERGEPFALEPREVDLLTTFGTLIAAFLERAIEQGELRRLNELKSQFAAIASHELRTPVSAVYGAARTLEERGPDLTPGQRAQLHAVLLEQSKRLYELVENLLDLSRLEADSIRIVPSPILVSERLRKIIAHLFGGGDVVVSVDEDLSAVVDAQAFDRIVSNLLGNALRHGAPPVQVAAGRTSGELWVTVEDRGPGVPSDFVSSLFERFTRGATATGGGAGLGLSIAQSYARAHGGAVRYSPAEPQGACFRLVLPAGSELEAARD